MKIQHLKMIFASEPPSIKCSIASFDYRRVSTCINQHSMKILFIFHCDIAIVPLFKGYPCGSYASSMPCFSRIQWCGSAPGFLQPREKGRNGGCVCWKSHRKQWENHRKNGKSAVNGGFMRNKSINFGILQWLLYRRVGWLSHRDLSRSNPRLRCVIELFQGFANFVLAFRARGRRQYYVYNYVRFILQIRWYNGSLLSYVFFQGVCNVMS